MYAGRVVESCRASELHQRAAIPTPAGCLACLPRVDRPAPRAAGARPRSGLGAERMDGDDRSDAPHRRPVVASARRHRFAPSSASASTVADGRDASAWSANPARQVDRAARHRADCCSTGPAPSWSPGRPRHAGATELFTSCCRWCSRTLTARCIRATRSTADPGGAARRSTASAMPTRASNARLTRSGSARRSASASRTSSPAASASASPSPAP